jgi:hypothetical protein
MYSPLTDKHFATSENTLELERLRVPSGWLIGMNRLYVGLDGGSDGLGPLLFCARHEGRRFGLNVDWLPEFDADGSFHLTVTYQPWPRDERGRRRKNVPFAFDGDERTVHAFETQSYPELLKELERCLDRCRMWMIEGN